MKWGIKAWVLADRANVYLLKCDIYKGKKEIRQQDLLLGGTSCTTAYRKFLGKMASYLFRQYFQPHKSYENAIGARSVQLWHYKGK